MKRALEYILRYIPHITVVYLSYTLFISTDSQISQGLKQTLSALLGAVSSYIFIQYFEFFKKIDIKKAEHQNALIRLEFKLNDQLNWLSDIIFHLSNHEPIVQKVLSGKSSLAYDASSYRDPISIEQEIHDIKNIAFKNQLLNLHTSYIKIKNDLSSMHDGYVFMLEKAISHPEYMESYALGLPHHLANVNMLREFTGQAIANTKKALSACRVLSRDSRNMTANLNRYFVIHSEPQNFDALVTEECKKLEKEIQMVGAQSRNEINNTKEKLNY